MSNLRCLFMSVFFCSVAVILTGCCAPGAVRLTNKPSFVEPALPNGVKLALVVRDMRPEAIKKTNICGVNYQTAFHIPVAPMFLAHAEHFDSILINHVNKVVERAGFTVTDAMPKVHEISDREVSIKKFDKKDRKAAWEMRGEQGLTKEEKKQAKKHKKEGGGGGWDEIEGVAISPWGDDLDVSSADYVLEIKVNKFWNDYSYYGSVSWLSVNLALCRADDPYRTVLYGRKVYGFGYMFSLFTPLTPSSDGTISCNTAYWFVLNSIQKELMEGDIRSYIGLRKIASLSR